MRQYKFLISLVLVLLLFVSHGSKPKQKVLPTVPTFKTSIGTLYEGDKNNLGTFFHGVFYGFPTDISVNELVILKGPKQWNENMPFEREFSFDGNDWFWNIRSAIPITKGTFKSTTLIEGENFTSTINLDSLPILKQVTIKDSELRATNSIYYPDSIYFKWNLVPNAKQYRFKISWDGNSFGSIYTTQTELIYPEIELLDGRSYDVSIMAFSEIVNIVKANPDNINSSRKKYSFVYNDSSNEIILLEK